MDKIQASVIKAQIEIELTQSRSHRSYSMCLESQKQADIHQNTADRLLVLLGKNGISYNPQTNPYK